MTEDEFKQYLLSKVTPRVPLTEEQLRLAEVDYLLPSKKEAKVDKRFEREIKRYLLCVKDNPDMSATSYTKTLGLSTYMADSVRKETLNRGLAIEFTVNLGRKHGGNKKITELTGHGYKYLDIRPPVRIKGDGNPKHRWWQRRFHKYFNSLDGIKAEIEMHLRGKSADVGVVVLNSKIIAIEVELSGNNAMRNIKADIEARFNTVIVGCKNRSVQKAVSHSFGTFLSEHKDFPRERVKICLLPEILDETHF